MTAAGRDRLVALGDSITVGVGDTVGPDAAHGPGWAAHLAAVLGVDTFTNLATNGARSRDVADVQLSAALALRPGLATLLVGGNDVLRSDFDARLTLLDLRRCVDELRRAGADVVLVRLPVIGLFELAPRLVRRVMRRRVAAINAAVDRVAEEVAGRVVVVDAAAAIAPAGARAWHVDRVHPSPAGHRRLALAVGAALAALDAGYAPDGVLPAAPDPPGPGQRLTWLVRAGLPWCVRRGRDFLPGLLRAVVHDLRAERVLGPGATVASLADSGLDPRRRIGRG
ncbi:GDSL-type esterase/lipase family protein [Promicromonospora thailandica]|uniref:Lysophospholipase L1 n=1 Tax=Promicromonospora thailandica TaxID=765201 RepID=A0A9X2G3E7_9MICO|nr:GDSL-type esterase/lipase family protein [Promicromonospora thailandica]MCP2266332.1 Lysophospholipase L1 [Promicromonospora thailandica]BFF20003.1 hypothetical protein GCM10025730_35240 [Promicromonospora thailandica]